MYTQQRVSQQKLEASIGQQTEMIVDEYRDGFVIGRTLGDAPEIDGQLFIETEKEEAPGTRLTVKIIDADEYDRWGEVVA